MTQAQKTATEARILQRIEAATAPLVAEIEGWKKDRRENLSNQCELQAEVNTLRAQVSALQAQQPLTFWQVAKAFTSRKQPRQPVDVFRSGVRFAEKHHGIKGVRND